MQFTLDRGSSSRGSERPFSCASFCRGLHNPFVKHSFSMRLNMTGVNICVLVWPSNGKQFAFFESQKLKIFSPRGGGASGRRGQAPQGRRGRILLRSRVSFANIGCKCCAFFGASLPEQRSLQHRVMSGWEAKNPTGPSRWHSPHTQNSYVRGR